LWPVAPRLARWEFTEKDPTELLENLDTWGHPRAWTDEKIASWTVEHIAREWGQALVFADCLASQWTEAVTLRAWLEQVIWTPYAPEVTSWLQEPDTHEHAQLKAKIREVKSELHWALESEWLEKMRKSPNKEVKYPSSWGPFECLWVIGEAYKRFREESKNKVPLEGLQANQMLRVRPTAEGTLAMVTGLEPWSFLTEPGRGIPPRLKAERDAIIEEWPENIPPVPDWSFLEHQGLVLDDLPEELEAEGPEVCQDVAMLWEHMHACMCV